LRELNRRTQEEIDHNNQITAPLLKKQLLKSKKREKQIGDFREAGMLVAPNTYNTLNKTLHEK
jgi:adenosylmethionine-8-amino-7-oxononanoate aminotransferase